ncbi:MAG: hypothetical protein WDA42_06030 [Candidatus Bathyarchaeia archaeon]
MKSYLEFLVVGELNLNIDVLNGWCLIFEVSNVIGQPVNPDRVEADVFGYFGR